MKRHFRHMSSSSAVSVDLAIRAPLLVSHTIFGRPKYECANLNTLARRRVRQTARIVKRRMCRKARAAVLLRIVALDQQCLVPLHIREIEPTVIWIVSESVGLAHSVLIDEVARHVILGRDTPRVTNCERRILQGPTNRPPDIDLRETAFQKRLSLVREKFAHSLRARFVAVIVVYGTRRRP